MSVAVKDMTTDQLGWAYLRTGCPAQLAEVEDEMHRRGEMDDHTHGIALARRRAWR